MLFWVCVWALAPSLLVFVSVALIGVGRYAYLTAAAAAAAAAQVQLSSVGRNFAVVKTLKAQTF